VLRAYGEDLWLADGPTVRFMRFFAYPTRMAVVRLADGTLWVWSPIALDDGLAAELAELGPVAHLVEPNALHHLSLPQWHARYPSARIHGAPGLAKKRPDVAFDSELADEPDPAWAGQIDQVVVRGSLFLDEVLFFHRASKTALACDLIQRFDPRELSGLPGWILRLWGLAGPDGSTPREWRASFWNRRAARRALATALAWSPERLVIAHGQLPEENGRDALARGLRWLRP